MLSQTDGPLKLPPVVTALQAISPTEADAQGVLGSFQLQDLALEVSKLLRNSQIVPGMFPKELFFFAGNGAWEWS